MSPPSMNAFKQAHTSFLDACADRFGRRLHSFGLDKV